mmetsp:Transcript_6719/g.9285  ORF Transcript_6719/g.9285 Transcript_6719/m.9285 type:complete len:266 (+) Transcript_6719:229-1026(+)
MGCFYSTQTIDPGYAVPASPRVVNDDEPIPSEVGIDYVFKVVVIGEASVGKTQSVNRFTHGKFTANSTSTVAVDFGMAKLLLLSKKNKTQPTSQISDKIKVYPFNDVISFVKKTSVIVNNQSDDEIIADVDGQFKDTEFDKVNIKMQLWDTAGQERYRAVMIPYYRGATGAIVMFDITSRESFNAVTHWLDEVRAHARNAVIIVVGNKSDLEHSRDVTTEEAQKFCQKEGVIYIEASAKSGANVGNVFYTLCYEIYKKRCLKSVS